MSRRAIVNGAIASAILWALILGAWQGIAHSAPSLQTRADVTADWMAATLHASVPHRTIAVYDSLPADRAGQMHDDGAVDLTSGVAGEIQAMPRLRAPGLIVISFGAGHVLVHELLHRPETAACWGPRPGGVDVEEGVVDALALDLLPAWGRRFLGAPTIETSFYPADVAAIRAASARATGSRTWRTRGARLWRRSLWAASCDGRVAMLGAVAT